MQFTIKPRVKICCISSILEARLAIKHGAAALGLVGHMPSGPGIIDDNLISEIVKTIPPPIASFLLTSEVSVNKIIAHHQKVNTNTIQLVDALQEGSYNDLKNKLPEVKIVQVIHVSNEQSINEAIEVSNFVDSILLDSGNPKLKIKQLGGTGKTHNWDISKRIVEAVNVPVFLAGGLNPENVSQAIQHVKPFGVDLCSGVRTNGQLDEIKLSNFFKSIQQVV